MLTVFGSIIVDNIYSVPNLPARGETVLAQDLFVGPGGKGANQAVAAAKAGGTVQMVGSVGDDALKDISLNAFVDAGVDASAVQSTSGPTGSAAVLVDTNGSNAISVAPGANQKTRVSQLTEETWATTSTLLLQMEIPFPEIESAIFEARERGVRSLLNLAPAAALSTEAFKALDILIVNEVELAQLCGYLGLGAGTDEELARRAVDTLGVALVVTLGEQGALAIEGKTVLTCPALAIDAVDTTGAGDAFCGVFAASLDAGLAMEVALQRGCVAGSLTCLKTGAQESQPIKHMIDEQMKS